MQNKANYKTEDRKQNTVHRMPNGKDSKIMAKDKPNVFYNCRESSTNQTCFMQNKANFKIGKMNISIATIKDYENRWQRPVGKNKANQSQF